MAGDTANKGQRVAVEYTGKLEDGTVFDSNVGDEPLWFTVGKGEVITGFDDAVEGMPVGGRETVKIPAENAYGTRDEELVIPVRSEIFGEADPETGMEVALRGQDGTVFNGRVVEVKEGTVHVDLNHPLAGKDLVFDIEVKKIE